MHPVVWFLPLLLCVSCAPKPAMPTEGVPTTPDEKPHRPAGLRLVASIGHKPEAVAMSPDQQWVATVGKGQWGVGGTDTSLVKLWEVATGRLADEWIVEVQFPGDIWFDESSDRLAVSSYDGVIVLDVVSGEILPTLFEDAKEAVFDDSWSVALVEESDGSVSLAELPSETTRASLGTDGALYLNMGNGLVATTTSNDKSTIFRTDGTEVFTFDGVVLGLTEQYVIGMNRYSRGMLYGHDGTVKFERDEFYGDWMGSHSRGRIRSSVVARGGYIVRRTEAVSFLEFEKKRPRWTWPATDHPLVVAAQNRPGEHNRHHVADIDYNAGADALIVAVDSDVYVLDAQTGRERQVFNTISSDLLEVAVSPDGAQLSLSKGTFGWVQLDLERGGVQVRDDVYSERSIFADTRILAAGDHGRWTVANRAAIRDGEQDGDVAVAADSRAVARVNRPEGILRVEPPGQEAWEVSVDNPHAVSIAPDGARVAVARGVPKAGESNDKATTGTIDVFEVGRATPLWSVRLTEVYLWDTPDFSLDWSPDGQRLVVGEPGIHGAKLFDGQSGARVASYDREHMGVSDAAFHPDGSVIAISTGMQGVLLIWNPDTGDITELPGHADNSNSVVYSPDGDWLYSAGRDGALRVWDTANYTERATAYIEGEDWIFLDHETGRFDGSEGGMAYLHYVDGLDTLPLSSLFAEYYTPRLMASVLLPGTGTEAENPPIPVRAIQEVAKPPEVTFVSPPTQVMSKADLALTVRVSEGGAGIADVLLYHNGKAVGSSLRGLNVVPKDDVYIFNVSLLPGLNHFEATAFNGERVESKRAKIVVEREEVNASAALYIVAVGINEYKNSTYNLNYGKPDAEAFVKAIQVQGKGIFSAVHVQKLIDAGATRQSIFSALDSVAAEARPQDAFLFYYAGHGVMSAPEDSANASYFLVPSDVTRLHGQHELLLEKGVSAAELTARTGQIGALKQLIVLDACQSAGALEAFSMRGAAEEKAILQLSRSAGVTVLAAAGSEQFAAELDALGHGLFTHALLEGIAGRADAGDGKITVRELEAFVNDEVPALTEKYRGAAQYPNSFSRGQDFPIAIGD